MHRGFLVLLKRTQCLRGAEAPERALGNDRWHLGSLAEPANYKHCSNKTVRLVVAASCLNDLRAFLELRWPRARRLQMPSTINILHELIFGAQNAGGLLLSPPAAPGHSHGPGPCGPQWRQWTRSWAGPTRSSSGSARSPRSPRSSLASMMINTNSLAVNTNSFVSTYMNTNCMSQLTLECDCFINM